MEKICKYLTRDNITLAIAIAGFLLSVINIVKDLILNRSKISINLDRATMLLYRSNHPILFRMIVENKSRLPICISRMFLVCNGKTFEFEWIPERVFNGTERQGEQVLDSNNQYSTSLPSVAQGLGAIGGFFFVYTDNDYTIDDLIRYPSKIIVNTNRGKKKFNIKLDDKTVFAIEKQICY